MSFQQGLSGLSAAAINLEVIANNISNASTIGAKSSRAEFSDLYAEAAGGQRSAGIGTALAAVTQDHTQGSISTTGRNLDLAINGDGYFQIQVSNQVSGQEASKSTLYTRNGQFKTDRDGWIVTNDGAKLLGFGADETGAIRKGQLQEMKIPEPRLVQKQTDEVVMSLNLNASDVKKPVTVFNQNDGNSFNYSASIKVFDEAGQSVEISTFYKKSEPNKWEVYVTANGQNVPPKASPTAPPLPINTIEFTTPDGAGPPLKNGGTPGAADQAVLTIGAADLNTALNTPTVTASGLKYTLGDVKLNLSGAGQQSGDYTISRLQQNGYGVGTLSSFSFDDQGVLTAKYTNGQDRATGQLAIASFRNPQGLQPAGGNAWKETQAVGAKVMDVPGTGNLGDIVAGAVEESNVDLTAELVNLITAQRTYQANAQSIKTQDQVTQTFLNMR
ncbi:MAG: flagellar hook protein FlgE [Rubrivivax sp.]|jgi:flagellar hook protein FlgE